MHYTLHYTL